MNRMKQKPLSVESIDVTGMPGKTAEIWVVVVLMGLVFAAVFLFVMNSPIDHNEHMYVAAGKLCQSEKLYTDFAFLQMPYMAVFYGLVFKIMGSGGYLMAARFSSFLFLIFSGLLVFSLAKVISRDRFVSLVAFMLFTFNEVIILTMKEASNYNLAMFVSLLAIFLFGRNIRARNQSSWVWFFFGMMLALSIGIKLYYVFSIFPFALVLIFSRGTDGFSGHIKTTTVPVGLGFFTGILPLIYFLIRDADNFIFNNLGYHFLNSRYFLSLGFKTGVGVSAKISYFGNVFKLNSNLAILLCLVVLIFHFFYRRQNKNIEPAAKQEVILLCLLVFFSAAGLFFLTPLWIQYFAFPIPYLIVLVVSLYSVLPHEKKSQSKMLMGFVLLIAVVSGSVRLFQYADRYLDVDEWMVKKVYDQAKVIKREIPGWEKGDRIATLSPIFVVDSDMGIYNEFSTGPFLYRVGNLLSETQLAEFRGVSSERIQIFLDRVKPRAFLVGQEPHLEGEFIRYAGRHGYQKIDLDFYGLSVFVK